MPSFLDSKDTSLIIVNLIELRPRLRYIIASLIKTISNITYISLLITYANYSNLIREDISSLIGLISYSLLYNRYKSRRPNHLLGSN